MISGPKSYLDFRETGPRLQFTPFTWTLFFVLQCIDVNKALRDFQTRMYSAQFMTLAVISRGENDSGFQSVDHHDMRVAPELTPVRGQKPSPVCG